MTSTSSTGVGAPPVPGSLAGPRWGADSWPQGQWETIEEVERNIEQRGIDSVRCVFVDPHGMTRGKSITVPAFRDAMADGIAFPSTLILKDIWDRTVFPVHTSDRVLGSKDLAGVGDLKMVPDPATFKVLPWSPRTGWVLSDLEYVHGESVEFSPRALLRRQVEHLANRGLEMIVGLEVEFYVFQATDSDDDGPALIDRTWGLLKEVSIDAMEDVTRILKNALDGLGLALRSIECELGPSQVEVTFEPMSALDAADAAALFRTAVKQACRQAGYIATFMCRPAIKDLPASGWHLNMSLAGLDGNRNVFGVPSADRDLDGGLSPLGRNFLGGLLHNARAASVFTTPTVNGYKRLRPMSLAPNKALWAVDNRAAMLRVAGTASSLRIENRSGEPLANPYFFIASQIAAGLSGLTAQSDPGPPVTSPYAEVDAPDLPRSLEEACRCLAESQTFREGFGDLFVDYLLALKKPEIEAFNTSVTDWEQATYFEA